MQSLTGGLNRRLTQEQKANLFACSGLREVRVWHWFFRGSLDESSSPDETANDDEGDESAVQIGDVQKWVSPVLPKGQMRLITGETAKSERQKDAALTVMTYQGFSTISDAHIHRNRKVGLLFFDEAHRISSALREKILRMFPGALRIGGSATMKGPPGSRPFEIFEACNNQDQKVSRPFHQQLAYHSTIGQAIDRKELKPVRCLQKGIDIDLSDVSQTSSGNLNQDELTRKMMYSIPVLAQFIREAFDRTYPILELCGTKPVAERTFIVSVKRIELAQKLAEICSKELGIHADWTSGQDKRHVFQGKIQSLARGKVQMLFSAGKLGEGLDVTQVNGIISLWPYNRSSDWVLKQLIGRGTRLHEGDQDCLVIEPIFEPGEHKLASTPDLFHVEETYPGVLLAPQSSRDVELRMMDLLNKRIKTGWIWNKGLTPQEREIAEQIGWKDAMESTSITVDQIPLIRSQRRLERLITRRFSNRKQHDERQPEATAPKEIDLGTLSTEEIFEEARRQLQKRGFTRKIMATATAVQFSRVYFGPFGGGLSFYNRIAGKKDGILLDAHLRELSEILFPKNATPSRLNAMNSEQTRSIAGQVRPLLTEHMMRMVEEKTEVTFSREAWGNHSSDASVIAAVSDIADRKDVLRRQLLDAVDPKTFHLVAVLLKIVKLVEHT